MNWWMSLILIILGCIVGAFLMLLPFGYVMGGVFSSLSKQIEKRQ